MVLPLAATLVPIAVVTSLSVLLLVLIWLSVRHAGPDGSDDTDSGSDGGGGTRPPRRPPPVGPVSWPEFERQFAAYVARCDRERRQRVK